MWCVFTLSHYVRDINAFVLIWLFIFSSDADFCSDGYILVKTTKVLTHAAYALEKGQVRD